MAGMVSMPMAATVAGPEPLMAAKNMQVRMVAMAMPPYMPPTISSASSKSCLLMPPTPIMIPAAMKK